MMQRIRKASLIYMAAVTLLVALLPASVTAGYLVKRQTQLALDGQQELLESTLQEKKRQAGLYYKQLQYQLELWMQREAVPFLADEGRLPVWTEMKDVNRVYLFDANQKPAYSSTEQGIEEAGVQLKQQMFEQPWVAGDFTVEGKSALQHLFYKIVSGQEVLGYFVGELNHSGLVELLSAESSAAVELFNNKYEIVATPDPESMLKRSINPISKKMLDGNTGYEKLDGDWYAYSFVNLDGQSLFLTVRQPEAEALQALEGQSTILLFLLTAFAGFGLFVGLKQFRRMQELLAAHRIEAHEYSQLEVRQTWKEKEERVYGRMHAQIHYVLSSVQRKVNKLRQEDREYKLLGYYQNVAETLDGFVDKNNQTRETMRYFGELNSHFVQQYLHTKEQLQQVTEELGKAQSLLDQRINMGAANEDVEVQAVWAEAMLYVQGRMETGNIRFEQQFEHTPRVMIQRELLEKTFRGILENAYQAILKKRMLDEDELDEHEDEVNVICRFQNNRICIQLRDTGGGIRNELRKYYFSPTYSRKDHDESFSLYQIDQFMEQIGGKILLENEARGLLVTISFPVL
ncbi:hypothetical protein DNH61_17415 [Paenibacillus sambharensis]|uniref:Histidine kinase domain-containing protein n=1 Tax=Paenibacillus sambharensis TaxID=1803190 RepID=A0A2W1LTF3_9BACL|nr:ATP-binding protein [Paenibacillus sambharensis]PZD94727.1 hypothetical protein DNH61_17415 [Paenibacillus sambharensis]